MRCQVSVSTPISERQLVLVTGKGGVGKTTLTAALARASQEAGYATLVAEMTPDPSTRSQLLSHFGVPTVKGEQPVELGPHLDGTLISPSTGHRLFLRAALRVGVVADAAMRSAALNRFLLAAPAFPEIGSLYQLVWLLRQNKYSRIFVDLPATGHALSLVKLPGTVLKVVPRGLIRDAIAEGLEILTNETKCGVVIATLPERLPVSEAFDLRSGLEDVQVPVGAFVLNRVPSNPFTEKERQALDEHIRRRQGELLLGTREFRRLERAVSARAIFYAEPKEDALCIELPIFEGSWSQVIHKVSSSLTRAGVAPLSPSNPTDTRSS